MICETTTEEGEVISIGFIGVNISDKIPFGINYGKSEDPICWISSSFVVPNFRGKGIGKQLYTYAENFAKEKNISELWCDVFVCNEVSTAFHEKLGFKKHIILYKKDI